MSNYQLIALDMDGTLLNSQKKISKKNLEMINKAIQAGKEVILCTGRCPAELEEYIELIPGLRYLDCLSGALVYDLKEENEIYSNFISADTVLGILKATENEDIMYHMMTKTSMVQKDQSMHMDDYQMGIYTGLFETCADKYENILDFYKEQPFPLGKLNLYHRSPEARSKTHKIIQECEIPVMCVNAEIASLELSAMNVNKGTGLQKLCEHLGMPIDETIVMGDAANDVEALKVAGLAVAMGNAIDEVKEIADVVVSDCDHDGCAEAIERYLI
jgi:hypothetical protein